MRTLDVAEITGVVARLCVDANLRLPPDMAAALNKAGETEPWPLARDTLGKIRENMEAAAEMGLAICQDTGMACVFLEVGQDVHLVGGSLCAAVDEGVRQGYTDGYLRKSVVRDPVRRGNTGDNTPAVLYTEIVPGDQVKVTVAPKGFGSENMSRVGMLKPAQGQQGVEDFIFETARLAGPNPCPPMVLGVGVGGTFERCALLAKRALLRPADSHHPDPFYADMERRLLERVNKIGTGPAGYGGKTTALAVLIETYPTHIAGLPVAVNISCHVTRHASAVL